MKRFIFILIMICFIAGQIGCAGTTAEYQNKFQRYQEDLNKIIQEDLDKAKEIKEEKSR